MSTTSANQRVAKIAGLTDEDVNILLADYLRSIKPDDLNTGISKDKRSKLTQIIKFLKIEHIKDSTTMEEVESKVKEQEKKDKIAITRSIEKYNEMCEGKLFIASKAVNLKDGFECLREISTMKMKLETHYGANMGAGDTYKYLKDFKENEALGAGSIILNDDVCLHHGDLEWLIYYKEYSKRTKHGVLILAGRPKYFQIWAKSKACLNEVSQIPKGKLFAYIEHRLEDGFDKNEGFIVHVDAKNKEGEPTVENGKGYMIFHNGDYYHGELRKGGKRNGFGTNTCADGDKYEGQWKDDKIHGSGVHTWADGNVYDGQWKDDKMHGSGVFTWADGDVYDGKWKDDSKHGSGVFTHADGDVYDGEWKDDKTNGFGTETCADGDKYEGQWKDDNKHGSGVFTWANGDKYEGQWKDDNKHGSGVFTHANGKKTKQVWDNDKCISDTKINE